jgi:drug/metabolite transporter (DMT)-like permease
MSLGIFFGLLSAFIWSTTSLLVKARAAVIDTLSFNLFRIAVSAIFFLLLVPFFGGFAMLLLPLGTVGVVAASVVFGFCIGDSIYFWSMTKIGAARTMPISGVYPVFTWLIAIPLLGEHITLPAIAGTMLVIIALFLLGREHNPDATEANEMLITLPDENDPRNIPQRTRYLGVAAAIFAAFAWAISTTLLRLGLQMQNPLTLYDNLQQSVLLGALRLVVATLVLFPVVHFLKGSQVWKPYRRRTLLEMIVLGIYSTGIGTLFFVLSVALAGAARASLLNTASPVIGVLLAWLFMREPVTRRVWAGTALAVVGVWLVLV